MKAVLEFDLPEDNENYEIASNYFGWYNVVKEMDRYLRNKLKYEELTKEEDKVYQDVRTTLRELACDNNCCFK